MLILMVRCVLYPGSKLFVTSGVKEQAAGIMKEKVAEICSLVPAFEKELDRSRGATLEEKIIVSIYLKINHGLITLPRRKPLEASVVTVKNFL